MKIRISYHIAAVNGWQQLTYACIEKMTKSRLWEAADEIHLMCHYDPEIFHGFIDKFKDNSKITWHMFTDSVSGRGESFSNYRLKEICDKDTEEWAVLRLHNKSSNYVGHPDQGIAFTWRDSIEYWNIDRWELLHGKLKEGFDVAGQQWLTEPWPHFCGNIWWATSSHIRKLPLLPLPSTSDSPTILDMKGWSNRHEAEAWVGLVEGTKSWSAWPDLTDWGCPGVGVGWTIANTPFNNKED